MLTFSRKPLGIWLVTAFVLGASFLVSLFLSNTAFAATGTWKTQTVITVNGVDYTGPATGFLTSCTTTTASNWQIFKPATGTARVYFATTTDLKTATSGYFSNNGKNGDPCSETLTLTNTQSTAGTGAGTGTGGTGTGTGTTDARETCNVANIGWIVCPVSTFLGTVTDLIYALVEKFLVYKVAPNPLDTSNNNPVYVIWSSIRNLANIAFIFAFFAIIFSQATSIGLASYGIKKMLPRLIVAAILVNLSYFICVFAVDVSNIIGASIDGIIRYPLTNGLLTTSDPATGEGTWTGIISSLLIVGLGGAAIAGATVPGALAAALPFLVVALFAALTALVVLLARQALMTILIVISPLAFVAYILPNTEDSFNKWRKLFMTMLVFYPITAVIFAGAQVAAAVLRLTSNDGTFEDAMIKVMSLAVQAFPLFALPFMLKFAGGLLGRIGGMINNPNRGPFDSLKKRAQGYRDTTQARARAAALKRPRPDYTGRSFGKTRTAVANANIFSSRRAAQSAVDRERALGEAKTQQEQASRAYYAGRVAADDNYASRMAASDDTEAIARVRAPAMRELIKQNAELREAYGMNLTSRNGAALAASGLTVDATGTITGVMKDAAGNDQAIRIADWGRNVDPAVAQLVKDNTGVAWDKVNGLDISTRETLDYITHNRLLQTPNGAKAVAGQLAQTGGLTSSMVESIVRLTPDSDKTYVVDHINEEAGRAGLKHLSYNTLVETVRPDGTKELKVQLGGQFGGIDGTVDRLMQNGVSSLTKEMYTDKAFGTKLAESVDRLERTSPETFDAELVKMDPRKIQNLALAKLQAGLVPPYANYAGMNPDIQKSVLQTVTQRYIDERARAVDRYGLSG